MLKHKKASTLARYKGIIASVALFLLLDASVLMMNFYISFEIADDAADINLAGRQRMLSQRLTKTLFDLEYSQGNYADTVSAAEELALTRDLFHNTLIAFDKGGFVSGANGDSVELSAVTSTKGRASIEKAKILWAPYDRLLSELITDLENNTFNNAILTATIEYARNHNLQLLKLMNNLTVDLEQVASSKATRLRMIQTVGISLAILNFFLILFHFLRQLRDSDAVIESARKETTEILDTVKEGLFLVDQQLNIGSQHSRQLSEIIGQHDIAGKNLAELLESMVSPKDLETAKGFIGLLFNPKVKEKLIKDLNPLNQVQINIDASYGHYTTRYLTFDFARVYEGDEILHVLVSATDITETVMLSQQLEQEKAQNEQQLEMLTSILHTNSDLLKSFINKAYDSFNRINNALKEPGKSASALRQKLDEIYREIHNFKGEASSLQLYSFADIAHDFESRLEQLKQSPQLHGNDFLSLTVRLDKLISHTQSIDKLTDKLAVFSNEQPNKTAIKSLDNSYYFNYVEQLSERNGKHVNLYCSGMNDDCVPMETQELIRDISIQFLRNAIVHGIETPEQRLQSQKKANARIELKLARVSDGTLELVIEDDGQGIDYEAIRQQAISSGNWSETELESWDNKRLLSLIFTPGFSTAHQVTQDAGRGMGMDIIKNRIQQHRGKIQVATRHGRYTRFTVNLPYTAVNQQAA